MYIVDGVKNWTSGLRADVYKLHSGYSLRIKQEPENNKHGRSFEIMYHNTDSVYAGYALALEYIIEGKLNFDEIANLFSFEEITI
jgi:hypothetical protein